MEILLTGQALNAATAFRMGLVNRVVPPEELLPEARRWAERIMENAPVAVEAVKRSVLTGLRLPLQEAFEQELQLDYRINEHIVLIPAGQDHQARLETTVFQPNGPGPFSASRMMVWKSSGMSPS